MEPTIVFDTFDGVTRSLHWNRLARGAAWVEENGALKMTIQDAAAGMLSVAQIDDYLHLPRQGYLWRPPLRLKTRLRVAHPSSGLLGTAGIGFWNNPMPLWGTRMEVKPNWIWFYYASPDSTIALTDGPTSGWKASIVHAGPGGETMMALSDRLLRLPVVGPALSGMRMPAHENSLDAIDFTVWRDLTIEWLEDEISFWVDGVVVLHAHLQLQVPQAFVAWLDNNYAALTPDGKFDIGNLAVAQEQSLELSHVEIIRLSG